MARITRSLVAATRPPFSWHSTRTLPTPGVVPPPTLQVHETTPSPPATGCAPVPLDPLAAPLGNVTRRLQRAPDRVLASKVARLPRVMGEVRATTSRNNAGDGSGGGTVGVGVGLRVAAGTGVETAVGVSVGTGVGTAVGVSVGTGVGTAVGVSVGTRVGIAVGVSVGTGVGTAVGVSVGTGVGTAVGVSVGTPPGGEVAGASARGPEVGEGKAGGVGSGPTVGGPTPLKGAVSDGGISPFDTLRPRGALVEASRVGSGDPGSRASRTAMASTVAATAASIRC
ncbi:MAG: hypothetical protein J4F43_08045 [Dehalococcoidia bacterium]|nr:hypothetical protein [Dehalococcoidia bacterium]